MHKQSFHSVAHGRTLNFCIVANLHCHFHISGSINKSMAHACASFNNGNSCVHYYSFNQACTAAGNNYVYQTVHMNQIGNSLSVASIYKLHTTFRNASSFCCFGKNVSNGDIGLHRFAATFQNYSITGFKAQTYSICSNIGTSFVNDTNNAQGYTHFSNAQTISKAATANNVTNRIRQSSNLFQAFRHTGNTFRCKFKSIKHGSLHAFCSSSFHIHSVCC